MTQMVHFSYVWFITRYTHICTDILCMYFKANFLRMMATLLWVKGVTFNLARELHDIPLQVRGWNYFLVPIWPEDHQNRPDRGLWRREWCLQSQTPFAHQWQDWWQRGALPVHGDSVHNPRGNPAEQARKPVLDTDSKPSSRPDVQPDSPGSHTQSWRQQRSQISEVTGTFEDL